MRIWSFHIQLGEGNLYNIVPNIAFFQLYYQILPAAFVKFSFLYSPDQDLHVEPRKKQSYNIGPLEKPDPKYQTRIKQNLGSIFRGQIV